jgi:alkanesulfonate monooxygenase SsuD/methylene tetrahydromethanopterin reductase-like flavin-dependent oxidoreductase (luciferase family)
VAGGRFIFGVGVGWDAEEFNALGLPFAERGRMSADYLRAIKAAWAHERAAYAGAYVRFSGAAVAPRPLQRPHPPIWVGGSPSVVSRAALRRCVARGDAWHPLGLSLEDLERGWVMLRQMAAASGRQAGPGLAPRHLLDLRDRPLGSGRAVMQGSRQEVAADLRRLQTLGAEWLSFDLPRQDVPSMRRAMARFAAEVRPEVAP